MKSNRGNWYLLTAFLFGLSLGLIYAWLISPIAEVDTHPSALREDYQDIYRALIARAYQANSNLPRAKARLDLLDDDSPALALAAQAQRFLAEEGDLETAKVLANLSSALQAADQQPTPAAASEAIRETEPPGTIPPTPSVPAVNGPASTPTTLVAPSQTPTEAPPFIVQDSAPICDPTLGESLIQVFATNASGEGIAGVPLLITTDEGEEEQFFTGLKPELGLGYADYEAQPGREYQLRTPDSGVLAAEIEIPSCGSESGETYWGSWEVYITHPN